MNGEVTFRKALGGFNRNDVLDYINSVAVDNSQLQKANKSLDAADEEIKRLRSEIESKNKTISGLKQRIAQLENADVQPEKAEEVMEINNQAAEKLMQESMAYADRYIESANLVAQNIRKDIIDKLKDTDLRVNSMLERALVFSQETESFESMLKFFKAQISEIKKSLDE